jgi:predicted RND superfamily exporter protein
VRAARVVVASVALLLLCCLPWAAELKFSFGESDFFAAQVQDAAQQARLVETWGSDDHLVAMLVHGEGSLLAEERWGRVCAAAEATAAETPLTTVGGLTHVVDRLFEGEPSAVPPGHPLVYPMLLSADATKGLLLFQDGGLDGPGLEAAIAKAKDAFASRGLDVEATGGPMIRATAARFIQNGLATVLALSLPTMVLLLGWSFRSTRVVATTVAVVAATEVGLAAAMGAMNLPVGLLSQVAFCLAPAMALIDTLHLLSTVSEERGGAVGAMRRAWACTAPAIVLTWFTSSAGFLALWVSDLPAIREFALAALMGHGIGMLATLVLAPAVALSINEEGPFRSASRSSPLERLSLAALRAPRVVAAVVTVSMGWAAWGAFQLPRTGTVAGVLPPDDPAVHAIEVMGAELGGAAVIQLEARMSAGWLASGENLERLYVAEARLRRHPQVMSVVGPGTAWRVVTGNQAEKAREWASRAPGRMPQMLSGDGSAGLITVGLRSTRTSDIVVVGDELSDMLRGELPGAEVAPGGAVWLAARGLERLSTDLSASFGIEVSMVALVVLVTLGSWRVALVTLAVNALPLLFGCAWLWLAGGVLTPGPMVLLAVALGIVVDDTLHLLSAVHRHRHLGLEAALERAVCGNLRPVVLGAAVLVIGFGSLALSPLPDMQWIAVLGVSTVLTAVVADLVLLPPMLLMVRPWGSR